MHIATAQDCSACHGVLTFSTARFNHLGISATCLSCHNGVIAAGKPVNHLVTPRDCASCHNTQGWAGVMARPPKPLPPGSKTSGRNP